jgi:hypothetical protein
MKYDYSFVKVSVEPGESPTLIIEGQNSYIFSTDQLKSKDEIEIALANAYLDPKRVNYTFHYPHDEGDNDPGGDIGGGR